MWCSRCSRWRCPGQCQRSGPLRRTGGRACPACGSPGPGPVSWRAAAIFCSRLGSVMEVLLSLTASTLITRVRVCPSRQQHTPRRAPPPRALAAHPAPAQRATGSCPAAHPSGACRSAACCQHSCAASPAGLPTCTANAGPPSRRVCRYGASCRRPCQPAWSSQISQAGNSSDSASMRARTPQAPDRRWGVQMVGIYSGLGAAPAYSTPRGDHARPRSQAAAGS
jgi:hypothetical protein